MSGSEKYGSGAAAWERMFQRVRLLVRPCQKVMPFAIFGNSLTRAVQDVQAKFFVASFSTDWRFAPERSHELVKALIAAQKSVQYIEVKSAHGHDAFLMEDEAYMRAVTAYMNNVDKDCRL